MTANASPIAENRKATFDHELLETFEAGLELLGHEVKSVKQGHLNLSGSYAVIRGGEAWLVNAQIPAYQPKNTAAGYEPDRTRRLLLHREEIARLAGKLQEKGLQMFPLKAYLKKGMIKLELGLGRSRKKKDKRDAIKKRETERDMRRIRA